MKPSLDQDLSLFHRFVAHVVVPTQKDIEESLLRRKKAELMQMLALDEVSFLLMPLALLLLLLLTFFCRGHILRKTKLSLKPRLRANLGPS